MRLAGRARGQALVEAALVVPLLVGIVVTLFQLGILFMDYISLVTLSRDVGRWLAVHPNQTDAQVRDYILASAPPNLSPASLNVSDLSTAFASSNPNDWPWSPRCSSLGADGRCASRTPGSVQRLALRYDPAVNGRLFLPAQWNLPFFQVRLPTSLPPYGYFVLVEPS